MVDAFLVICIVVAILILLISGIYLIINYQHPDDKNEAYGPKLVILGGFAIAGSTVLLLPLDIANNEGYPGCEGYDSTFCGGLNMEALWNVMFWLIPIWVWVLIPFMTFYYEADDGMLMAGTAYAPNPIKRSRFGQALCYEMFVIVIVGIIFAVLYATLSVTKVPVRQFDGGTVAQAEQNGAGVFTIEANYYNATTLLPFETSSLEDMDETDANYLQTVTDAGIETIELQVSVSTFYAGLMAWIGWWFFALFGGIGLAALPLDMIMAFVHRPKHMDAAEYAEVQMSLRERVNELVDIGELIKIEREQKAQAGLNTQFGRFALDAEKRKAARDERQAILGFEQAVYLLEKDVEDFQAVSDNYENYNPLIPYISLVLGACAAIISLFWWLHIIVYIFPDPPLTPFLNNYFAWFDKWFPLFGVLSIALFTVYLLFCAIKGCFKFGLRFLFFHIHPMKPGKTYMSSFMFNIALVLLCSLPVVQFCQEAFADYAVYAEIRQIFSVQINGLTFFGWFFTKNIFVYIFFGLTIITSIYLACRPQDQAANGQALRDRLLSAQRT